MSSYQKYVVRRILMVIPVLWGIGTIIFFIMRIVPGDVSFVILGEEYAGDVQKREQIRRELGLDAPIYVQYGRWLLAKVQLDLGNSLWHGRPVIRDIRQTMPVSINVGLLSTIMALSIALPLGVFSGVRRSSLMDYSSRFFALAGLAVPSFWLGLMLLLMLVNYFNWSPPLVYEPPWANLKENILLVLWPALAVSFRKLAVTSRMVRSTLLEVISQDYIRTARAKGLSEFMVIWSHALRNTMIPVLTIIGLEFAFMFTGSVVVEVVFNVPGMGKLLVDSIFRRDYPTIEGIVMTIALVITMVNLVVDLLYGRLDPRITYR